MSTEIQPNPSGRGTRFYIHLSNWSEFFSWFSVGVALSFLVQLIPDLILLYPLAFVLAIAYFVSNLGFNKTANILRIVAISLSLIGFWNLIYLYRDYTITGAMFIIVILVLGGLFLWLKK